MTAYKLRTSVRFSVCHLSTAHHDKPNQTEEEYRERKGNKQEMR